MPDKFWIATDRVASRDRLGKLWCDNRTVTAKYVSLCDLDSRENGTQSDHSEYNW